MNMKEFFKGKKIIIPIVFFIVLIVGTIVFVNSKNDGMSNTNEIKIYYRTYYKDKWSKWSKNGITSGDYENNIKNIQIKVKTRTEGYVFYNVYSNGKWINEITNNSKIKNNAIKGLSFENMDTIYNKYDICYRTYNKKDKWLGWACNGEVSGNSEENVTALEVKIIPKNVTRYEWLKDYNKTLMESSKNF